MRKTHPDSEINNKFITMDIETKLISDKIEIRCIGLYDGNPHNKELIQEVYDPKYPNTSKILYNLFDKLIVDKYNGYYVFLHNSSNFDIIFILRTLVEKFGEDNISIIKRENQFIDVTVSWLSNKDKLHKDIFVDETIFEEN